MSSMLKKTHSKFSKIIQKPGLIWHRKHLSQVCVQQTRANICSRNFPIKLCIPVEILVGRCYAFLGFFEAFLLPSVLESEFATR